MTVNEMTCLRYVGASGDLSKWWQFLPADASGGNRLLLSLRLGSGPVVSVEVPVCSNRKPVPGCWVLVRRHESDFLLTAARLPRDMQRIAHSERFHEDLPSGSIALSCAPPEIACLLAEI